MNLNRIRTSRYRHNVTFRLITILLLCTLVLPSVSSRASVPEEPVAGRSPSLQGDPNFQPSQLPTDVLPWYNRLWKAINGDTYPDPVQAANSGDLYSLGRTLNDNTTALLTAFRYTGDYKLLDEVDRLLELARAKLKDTNNDGFLNWRWLNDSKSSYYGKDTHKMDEMLTHSMIAAGAYALYVNRGYKSVYAQHAEFWRDYLENHFLAKWKKRGGLDFELVHPYAQFMRFYYYMYKLTGKNTYLTEANRRATVLDRMMVKKQTSRGTAYTWDHRIDPPYGCQPTVYGLLTVSAFQDMWREGFNKYANDSYMQYYAATFRDLVLKYGISKLAGNVCGANEEFIGKFLISNIPGLAVWDDSGQILALTKQAYSKNENASQPTRVFIPAYLIQALYENGAQPSEPTPTVQATATREPTATAVTPTPTKIALPENGRVTGGLQVLYTFDEGSGATVHDQSGVGTPLDLTISTPAAVSWISGGLTVQSETIIASAGNATKIVNAARVSNEITLEAWIKTPNVNQTGPVRILTLSPSSAKRDFMLAQAATAYTSRLRTTSTDLNGKPYLTTAVNTVTADLTHLVYTRDAQGNARFYINGIESKAGTISGTFSNWENYRLVLANELSGSLLWKGSYYLVAVYSRALSADEVRQNLSAGAENQPSAALVTAPEIMVTGEIPVDVVPAEVVPAEIVPTEEIPTEVVPTEIVPTEVVPTEIVPPAEIVPAGGTGLLGEYYNDREFTVHALSRTDTVVDFNWGYNNPDPAVNADDFTIRWTGYIVPLSTETYTLYTQSDDGVRLWVNNQPLIDNWTRHGTTEDSATIDLIAGQPYPIRLEYYEGKAHAVIQLLWSSASQAKQVIPASQLFQTAPGTPDPTIAPPTETPPFTGTPQVIEAESETVVKVGNWTTHQTELASGLNYAYSSGTLDDTLGLTFEGTRVDVNYVSHPALGSFGIAVDGVLVQSINSQSTEAIFGTQVAIANLPAGQHTVSIYPLAGTIAIDAFIVEQQTILPTDTPVDIPTDPPAETVVPPVETLLPTSTPLPANLPFGDTFDSGLGWTVEGAWRLDPQTAVSGVSWFADSSQRGLVSTLTFDGSVLLGAALNPEISFSQKASLTGADWVIVEISNDGGLSWLPVDQQVGMVADWTLHTINLAAYTGQTIKLRFRFDTTGVVPDGAISIGYWIDNLMIQDALPTPTPTTMLPTDLPTLVPPTATMMPTSIPVTVTPALPTPEPPPLDASPTPSSP